jgi:hypothetical protein
MRGFVRGGRPGAARSQRTHCHLLVATAAPLVFVFGAAARSYLPLDEGATPWPQFGRILAHKEPTPGVVHTSEMNFFLVNHNSSSY